MTHLLQSICKKTSLASGLVTNVCDFHSLCNATAIIVWKFFGGIWIYWQSLQVLSADVFKLFIYN